MNLTYLRSLLGLTLQEPVTAARQIMALQLPMNMRWAFAFLTVSLAAILAWTASAMMGPLPEMTPDQGPVADYSWISRQPLLLAGLQLSAIVVASVLMAQVGRMFGGKGSFADALILSTWLEVLLLLVQVVQLILLPIAPGFAALLGGVSLGMFFYLTVQFTKALHGFANGWAVFLVMIATIVFLAFVAGFFAAIFGLYPEVPV